MNSWNPILFFLTSFPFSFVFAANLMLLPLNYLVTSKDETLRSPLAESSLNVLLILIHYHKCTSVPSSKDKGDNISSESPCREECLPEAETYISENPFRKAVENVRDIECMTLGIVSFSQLNDI